MAWSESHVLFRTTHAGRELAILYSPEFDILLLGERAPGAEWRGVTPMFDPNGNVVLEWRDIELAGGWSRWVEQFIAHVNSQLDAMFAAPTPAPPPPPPAGEPATVPQLIDWMRGWLEFAVVDGRIRLRKRAP